LNILVTGSTGLIGSALCSFLIRSNHRILRLVRRDPAGTGEIRWNPTSGILDVSSLEGLDGVVHLAGENIAAFRWTGAKKHRIRNSRILGTRLLARSLANLANPPKVLVSASAVGYYGNRGEEYLDEGSSAGTGFFPELCREWESATAPAADRGVRVVIPRIGVVLSATAGALALMLPIYRLGFGGRIGNGRQYMSWIAIDDLVEIFHHALMHPSLQGPINAVSPNPVTNLIFSKTLGRVLSRPAVCALPAFAAQLALGQMAEETLLSSARVSPARLIQAGFPFAFPQLESALRHALQKPKARA
jgi:uncharacterized protein (TIGR01777 family)